MKRTLRFSGNLANWVVDNWLKILAILPVLIILFFVSSSSARADQYPRDPSTIDDQTPPNAAITPVVMDPEDQALLDEKLELVKEYDEVRLGARNLETYKEHLTAFLKAHTNDDPAEHMPMDRTRMFYNCSGDGITTKCDDPREFGEPGPQREPETP